MTKKKRLRGLTVSVCLIAVWGVLPFLAACPPPPPPAPVPPEYILFGQATSLTGPYAPGVEALTRKNFEMWVEEVNARGGLYVPEYNKRIPVKHIRYDDRSDIGEMIKLLEKLILEYEVHFLFPPFGTAMNVAAAPIVSKHGYPLITAACTSEKLTDKLEEGKFPYMFLLLAQPRDIVPQQVEFLIEKGIERIAVIYVADEHGIEFKGIMVPYAEERGIDIALLSSYPLGVADLSPLLKEIKAADVDALIAYSYPPCTFLLTEQAMILGFNPKVFSVGVGGLFPMYRDAFGADVVEGIMVYAPVSRYSSPEIAEFFERFEKRWGREPETWGGIYTTAIGEIFEQAIAKVGLDRAKVRDVIATETFDTTVGPIRFVNNRNIYFKGLYGQWIGGDMHVIMPRDMRTHEPIFPKPPWPTE
ncbi:amino acid ABC transporter substrate-binding protein [Dehalococcoidia bacterium]|nr:amino acid ABC transporter substrate-binding protein [Dehalococcoidia bacterium]